MDSWATDGFYSHFPSYSQQPTRREELARARQHDYQTFLNNATPRKGKTDGKIGKRNTNLDTQNKKLKVSTSTPNKEWPKVDLSAAVENRSELDKKFRLKNTSQFVNELEKMDLPDFLNEDTINERNQKLAEDKRLKSIQYQQELMTQIEHKRRERELQRAKEQEEEERFLQKMEKQLKLIRSEDDECERQSRQREHQLINVEINKPIVCSQYTKPPATVRSEQLEPNVYTFRSYDERKAQSERGKENRELPKRNDKSIYNYFTNTAQKQANHLKNLRYNHYFDLEESSENEVQPNSMSSSSPLYKTYPTKSIRHAKPNCSFCTHNRFASQNPADGVGRDYVCDACGNESICLNCRKEICVQCKRPTNKVELALKVSPRHLKQRNHVAERPKIPIKPQTKPLRLYTESFQQIQTDEEGSSSDSPDHKPPYSFNIAESSVFHPSKSRVNRRLSVSIRHGEVIVQPDSFDELKRITDEKLLKLSKSYGEIRAKKPIESNGNASLSKVTADHPPLLRENTKKLIEFAKELERGDHNIYNRIESKHQVPAVQQKQIFQNNDTNTSTLTQVGAIKKQLQLDKLNF